MSSQILKSFTFVPQPKPSSDPLMIKRERMIARVCTENSNTGVVVVKSAQDGA
jgi:hypothetical protein